jgi:hypothetical membrane protein
MSGENDDEPPNFNSAKISLEEARRRYDNEEVRRDGLENKISILVTADTLILTLVGVFGKQPLLHRTVAVLPAMISSIIGLLLIVPKLYANPVRNRYYEYAEWDENEAYDRLFVSYIDAIERNEAINEFKFTHFHTCIFLTLSSLLLIVSIDSISLSALRQITLFIIPSVPEVVVGVYEYWMAFLRISLSVS